MDRSQFSEIAVSIPALTERHLGVCRCWCGGFILFSDDETKNRTCGSCGKKPSDRELMEMQAAANKRAEEKFNANASTPHDVNLVTGDCLDTCPANWPHLKAGEPDGG